MNHLKVDDLLQNFEPYFRNHLSSAIPLLSEMWSYSFQHSGKRIRPRFMATLCQDLALTEKTETFCQLATIVELVHAGTLFHDDVIDESSERRGQATIHKIFGNKASILLGDYAFTEAYRLACLFGQNNRELVDHLAQTARSLVEGELWQLDAKNSQIDWQKYEYILHLKTGCLFLFSAQTLLSLDEQRESILNLLHFAQQFGIFYQLIDDYLDYFADSSLLKKEPGKDFEERKMTLVPLLAIEKGLYDPAWFLNKELSWGEALRKSSEGVPHMLDFLRLKKNHLLSLLPSGFLLTQELCESIFSKALACHAPDLMKREKAES